MSKKEYKTQAVYVICHFCGCEYIEDKGWIMNSINKETKCPVCGTILKIT